MTLKSYKAYHAVFALAWGFLSENGTLAQEQTREIPAVVLALARSKIEVESSNAELANACLTQKYNDVHVKPEESKVFIEPTAVPEDQGNDASKYEKKSSRWLFVLAATAVSAGAVIAAIIHDSRHIPPPPPTGILPDPLGPPGGG